MFVIQGNYIDLIIIVVLLYFVLEAWHHGFWVMLADFVSFLGSLLISLRLYKYAAAILRSNFSLSNSIANALGFLISAILVEAILGYLLGLIVSRIPEKFWKNKWNKFLAIIPGIGEGLILTAFILILIIAFPIRPSIKNNISQSKIGGLIIKETSGAEKLVNDIFGGVIQDTLTYLTVEPGTKEIVPLNIGKINLKVDVASESEMFQLVNQERKSRGIKELTWNLALVTVARGHAMDMWQREYFGHYSPEGKDVGDRLTAAGISFDIAGENLALAPTVATAHQGLMNSPGHKANILDTRFNKIGIGVVDNGLYGKMFVQVFTN